jgi:hypothetical protein
MPTVKNEIPVFKTNSASSHGLASIASRGARKGTGFASNLIRGSSKSKRMPFGRSKSTKKRHNMKHLSGFGTFGTQTFDKRSKSAYKPSKRIENISPAHNKLFRT